MCKMKNALFTFFFLANIEILYTVIWRKNAMLGNDIEEVFLLLLLFFLFLFFFFFFFLLIVNVEKTLERYRLGEAYFD